MKYELLKDMVSGVLDNNSMNNARWSDWEDGLHIFNTYTDDDDNDEISDEDRSFVIAALDEILESKNPDKEWREVLHKIRTETYGVEWTKDFKGIDF